jgi:hypothetical protein
VSFNTHIRNKPFSLFQHLHSTAVFFPHFLASTACLGNSCVSNRNLPNHREFSSMMNSTEITTALAQVTITESNEPIPMPQTSRGRKIQKRQRRKNKKAKQSEIEIEPSRFLNLPAKYLLSIIPSLMVSNQSRYSQDDLSTLLSSPVGYRTWHVLLPTSSLSSGDYRR